MPQTYARRAQPKQSKPDAGVAPSPEAMEHNHDLIQDVISGVGAKRAGVRLGSSKALRLLSERLPALLYPHFDFFAAMLREENQVLKWNAILTLANLACVDREARLDGLLDQYLGMIDGPNMITAANAIQGAATIALARPELLNRILPCILRVERAQYATPECRNVAIGHGLRALERLVDLLPDMPAARLFAARQLGNPRAATSAKARRFLKARPASSVSASR